MRMSQVLQRLREEEARHGPRPRLMHRYASFLPVTSDTPRLSLGEGFTPLVHARNLGRAIGCPNLYLKIEGSAAWPGPEGRFSQQDIRDFAMARATSVATFLTQQGIDPNRMILAGDWTTPSASHRPFSAVCTL